MMELKKRTNVLAELLDSSHAEHQFPELDRLIHQTTALLHEVKEPSPQVRRNRKRARRERKRKRKTTHYLNEKIFHQLEQAKILLRRRLNIPARRISKSRIVNLALAKAFEELARKGEQSDLVHAIRKGVRKQEG